MKTLSIDNVVEQMTCELAARRRAMVGRRAAYLALAQAILHGDEQREPTPPREWESAGAA